MRGICDKSDTAIMRMNVCAKGRSHMVSIAAETRPSAICRPRPYVLTRFSRLFATETNNKPLKLRVYPYGNQWSVRIGLFILSKYQLSFLFKLSGFSKIGTIKFPID